MTNQEKIKVLLVDDHAMFRAGIRMLLETQEDFEVVGEADDGSEAIRKTKELKPDVVLMDIGMKGMNGLDATRNIKKASPATQVLALTMHDSEEYFFEMLEAGASGYVLKEAAPSDLFPAIRAAHQGEAFFYPSVAKKLLDDYLHLAKSGEEKVSYDGLTDREREVLKLIAQGLTNREVAKRLYLSVNTVEAHRGHIMAKLGLHNRAQLIKYAIKKKLINLDE